jgi:tetratricopeptide (TPR) repeat protein
MPLVNIGNIHLRRGELDEAFDNFKSALEIQRKTLPNDHPDIVRTLHNLAMVYRRQGNDEKARESFQQAEDIANRTLPALHPILYTLDAHKSHVFDIPMAVQFFD